MGSNLTFRLPFFALFLVLATSASRLSGETGVSGGMFLGGIRLSIRSRFVFALMDVIIDLKRIIFDRRIFMRGGLTILLELTHFKCFFFESKK